MRVTKAVRSYIEKQVEAKVAQKYEWEKEESQRICDLKNDIIERANKEAVLSAMSVLSEAGDYPDIFCYNPREAENLTLHSLRRIVEIKDNHLISSVHNWHSRMNKEIDEIVENIIVTLELGGNKTDLDHMLAEL